VFASASLAFLHANADLLVGVLIGVALGLIAEPHLRSWLTIREWNETSREARLTDDLISRLDRDLDEMSDPDEPDPDRDRTWPTSR
jgi:hypothetical protein